MNDIVDKTVRHTRRVVVAVTGTTIILVGIAMIVLPGPAFIVIPAGLAVLASEFVWARRLLRKAKRKVRELKNSISGRDRNGTKTNCSKES